MSTLSEFTKGVWKENPTLVIVLGMCPTLACTANAKNALGLGLATMAVLVGSNVVVSLVRNVIPKKVRIPCYIVVIATFVTIVEMLMKAWAPPALNQALGIFVPLIAVNCIVLGRAEAFASKNGPLVSAADGLGMGLGFTLALVALGAVREFLCGGSVFTVKLIPGWDTQFMLMSFAPGAFFALGCFLAGMNWLNMRKARKEGRTIEVPKHLDCRHCNICKLHLDD